MLNPLGSAPECASGTPGAPPEDLLRSRSSQIDLISTISASEGKVRGGSKPAESTMVRWGTGFKYQTESPIKSPMTPRSGDQPVVYISIC